MEVIISVAVITTAIVASVTLITLSVSAVRAGKNRTIAVHLAQEGIEIVKSIRDSNWLNYKRGADWTDDLEEGDYRIQYNDLVLRPFLDIPLKKDSNGFYQYDSGSDTLFYRKISITHIGDDQIKVVAEIAWQERRKTNTLQAEDRLYNWLKE